MLITLAFTLSLSLLSSAQGSANNTQLGVEAIEAHFNNSGIVPNLLKQFSPSALLSLNYDGVGQIQPGQSLSVDQVKPTPSLTVAPANSSITFSGNYTLAMVDADVVGADESKGQTRHWLANSVTVSGNTVALDHAVNITDYASPLPADGSGVHRYVIILYAQPSSFAPTGDLVQPNQPVATYDLNQYVSSSGLGPIVAATYYTVEQGTASSSAPVTSAVVTSTLPAASATGSGAGSTVTSAATPSPSAGSGNGNGGSTTYSINVLFVTLLATLGIVLVA